MQRKHGMWYMNGMFCFPPFELSPVDGTRPHVGTRVHAAPKPNRRPGVEDCTPNAVADQKAWTRPLMRWRARARTRSMAHENDAGLQLLDLAREGAYLAQKRSAEVTGAEDVREAVRRNRRRGDLPARRFREAIADGTIRIQTDGAVVAVYLAVWGGDSEPRGTAGRHRVHHGI